MLLIITFIINLFRFIIIFIITFLFIRWIINVFSPIRSHSQNNTSDFDQVITNNKKKKTTSAQKKEGEYVEFEEIE